jgi:hypothetical protein
MNDLRPQKIAKMGLFNVFGGGLVRKLAEAVGGLQFAADSRL